MREAGGYSPVRGGRGVQLLRGRAVPKYGNGGKVES